MSRPLNPCESVQSTRGGPRSVDAALSVLNRFCGGLFLDIKRKLPWLPSDFYEGFHIQSISAVLFIYLGCITNAITFGGLLGDATDNYQVQQGPERRNLRTGGSSFLQLQRSLLITHRAVHLYNCLIYWLHVAFHVLPLMRPSAVMSNGGRQARVTICRETFQLVPLSKNMQKTSIQHLWQSYLLCGKTQWDVWEAAGHSHTSHGRRGQHNLIINAGTSQQ